MSQALMHHSLVNICNLINNYISSNNIFNDFKLDEIPVGLKAYLERPGKKLRPAVLIWAFGAVGGNEEDISKILPIACSLETSHTWTLVHDDIIDCDEKRRGGDSIHVIGKKSASLAFPNISKNEANKYGETYSILIGDTLHSISVSLMLDSIKLGVNPSVVIELIKLLEGDTMLRLIEGELLDVKFEHMDIETVTSNLIFDMMTGKTGALIEYAATAGAMLGLNTCNKKHEKVIALANFAKTCGIAFQMQDDILGLTADETKLGKPVGSDVLEGKKTLTAYYALSHFNSEETKKFLTIYGNAQASEEEIKTAINMIINAGAIEKTNKIACDMINNAIKKLDIIDASKYKDLLISWADYMVNRDY